MGSGSESLCLVLVFEIGYGKSGTNQDIGRPVHPMQRKGAIRSATDEQDFHLSGQIHSVDVDKRRLRLRAALPSKPLPPIHPRARRADPSGRGRQAAWPGDPAGRVLPQTASLMAAALINLLISTRQEPQFVPARKAAPTASKLAAPFSTAAAIWFAPTEKQAQIMGPGSA